MPCCVCKVKTSETPYRVIYLTHCCKVDIHEECTYRICNRECPSCDERLDRNGYPKEVETVEEYVRHGSRSDAMSMNVPESLFNKWISIK